MRKLRVILSIAACAFITVPALAFNTIQLSNGQSITVGGQTVTCMSSTPTVVYASEVTVSRCRNSDGGETMSTGGLRATRIVYSDGRVMTICAN